MIIAEIRDLMSSKVHDDHELPATDKFCTLCYTAIKKIAKETTPLILKETELPDNGALRKISKDVYLRIPYRPRKETDIVDMDEVLDEAVVYYMLASIDKVRAGAWMTLFNKEILQFDDILVETSLDNTTKYEREVQNVMRFNR